MIRLNLEGDCASLYQKLDEIDHELAVNITDRLGATAPFRSSKLLTSITSAGVEFRVAVAILSDAVDHLSTLASDRTDDQRDIASNELTEFVVDRLDRERHAQHKLWSVRYGAPHSAKRVRRISIRRTSGTDTVCDEAEFIDTIGEIIRELYRSEPLFKNLSLSAEAVSKWGAAFFDRFRLYQTTEIGYSELETMVLGFCKYPPAAWWRKDLHARTFAQSEERITLARAQLGVGQTDEADATMKRHLDNASLVLCNHFGLETKASPLERVFEELIENEQHRQERLSQIRGLDVEEFRQTCALLASYSNGDMSVSELIGSHADVVRRYVTDVESIAFEHRPRITYRQYQGIEGSVDRSIALLDLIRQILDDARSFKPSTRCEGRSSRSVMIAGSRGSAGPFDAQA